MAGLLAGRWHGVRVTTYHVVGDVFQACTNGFTVSIDGTDCPVGAGLPRSGQRRSHPSDGLSRATFSNAPDRGEQS